MDGAKSNDGAGEGTRAASGAGAVGAGPEEVSWNVLAPKTDLAAGAGAPNEKAEPDDCDCAAAG